MKKLLLTIFSLATFFATYAQIQTPSLSPSATLIQSVGLMEVKIEYSRPSMRGRAVFGDLLPLGEIWRTGANASTKLHFNDDVVFQGVHELKKGSYALYTIPSDGEWTIIIHKNTSHWGVGNYNKEEDAFRFTVPVQNIEPAVETFTMEISNIQNDGATIDLLWEHTKVSFSFTTKTDDKVVASIEKALAGPDMNTYYQAASYYLTTGKDTEKAYEWINLCMEKGGKEKFWMVRRKALIEAELGKYELAIESAKLSMELAEKEKNADYVRMNQASIEEWSKK